MAVEAPTSEPFSTTGLREAQVVRRQAVVHPAADRTHDDVVLYE